jgi:hypothetical protein
MPSLVSRFKKITSALKQFGITCSLKEQTNKNHMMMHLTISKPKGTIAFNDYIRFQYNTHKVIRLTITVLYLREHITLKSSKDYFIQEIQSHKNNQLSTTWATLHKEMIAESHFVSSSISATKPTPPSIHHCLHNNKKCRRLPLTNRLRQWLEDVSAWSFFKSTNACGVQYTVSKEATTLPSYNLLVMAVKPARKHNIYNLTVTDPINSFIANGAIAHNCFYGFQITIKNIHLVPLCHHVHVCSIINNSSI